MEEVPTEMFLKATRRLVDMCGALQKRVRDTEARNRALEARIRALEESWKPLETLHLRDRVVHFLHHTLRMDAPSHNPRLKTVLDGHGGRIPVPYMVEWLRSRHPTSSDEDLRDALYCVTSVLTWLRIEDEFVIVPSFLRPGGSPPRTRTGSSM